MIVLGKILGIPKPFGPKVNGRCALDAEMCSLMEGLGLSCTFIDDFTSYHQDQGESCIDWNRDVMERELGLDDEDINMPILFRRKLANSLEQ
ncbi:Protein-arginine deiminase type-4 [Nibea albiflora]|nr:Protein-arginine deiminase type-4 [Nibea albiflora]